jgi:hypothetical protein
LTPALIGRTGLKLLDFNAGEVQSSFTPTKRVSLGSAIGGNAGTNCAAAIWATTNAGITSKNILRNAEDKNLRDINFSPGFEYPWSE